MKYLIISVFIILLFSCKQQGDNNVGDPIARINDHYIYKENLLDYLPSMYNDSTQAISEYLEVWITKELMTDLAAENLAEEIDEIEELVENYRSTLLIQKYVEKYIHQNLDTNVSDNELKKYYEEYQADFVLSFNAVKGLFIIVPKSSPDVYKVKNWYRSDSEEKIKKLDIYCNQYAFKYDDFNDDWVSFDWVMNEIPLEIGDQETYLKYNKSVETSDSVNYFYLKISDYKLKSDTSPFVFVKEKIKGIVINKRKIGLVKRLEKNLFQDAVSKKEVEIYN